MESLSAFASSAGPSPIFGRDAPLARLYDLAERPTGAVVQIVGEAGLGKTRLAEAAAVWALLAARSVLRGGPRDGTEAAPRLQARIGKAQ